VRGVKYNKINGNSLDKNFGGSFFAIWIMKSAIWHCVIAEWPPQLCGSSLSASNDIIREHPSIVDSALQNWPKHKKQHQNFCEKL